MPLQHTGVAIGTFDHFEREAPDDFGSWYHGYLYLTLPGARWQCALDVDTPTGLGIAYRIVDDARASDLGSVASLPDGWHELAHTSTSGAIDYVRTGWLQDRWVVSWVRRWLHQRTYGRLIWSTRAAAGGATPGEGPFIPDWIDSLLGLKEWLRTRLPFEVPLIRRRSYPWIVSTGDNALSALEALLPQATRIYVFGQRYSRPPTTGVHNVHMNQGDPPGSQWWPKNGPWQDGVVVMRMAGDRLVAWQIKFGSQSLNTDDQGHPV